MKKCLIILCAIALVACSENEISQGKENKSTPSINIITQKTSSPYLKLYQNDGEILARLSYTECKLTNYRTPCLYERNLGPNTLYLDKENKVGLRITDSYQMDTTNAAQTVFHIQRNVEVVANDKKESPSSELMPERRRSYNEFSISVQEAEPIVIYSPHSLEDQIIPLCYYSDMEVTWNADVNNPNGVVVIVEWDGMMLTSPDYNQIIRGVDIVEDTGSAILNDQIFDGIPDGALVSLYLLRGNIVELIGDNQEINLSDMSELEHLVQDNPGLLEDYLQDNPELIEQLQDVSAVCGSFARFAMILVRDL